MLRQAYLYLFNRGTGFQSSFIPNYPLFQPFTPPLPAQEIRILLGLTQNLVDAYGLAYLSLFDRHPEIRDKLIVPHTAFDTEDYMFRPSKINGGTLYVTETGDEGFRETPQEIPINFNYTVSYVSDTEVNIFTENFTRNYSAAVTDLAGDKLVTPAWDKRIPFFGSVIVPSWGVSDKFTLNYSTRSFPYSLVVSEVARHPAHMPILDAAGFTDQFLVARTDTEKLGWFIAALINTSYEFVQ